MKIRLGYVSNSSSSSFCVVGAVLTEKDFDIEKFKTYIGKTQNCSEYSTFSELFEQTFGQINFWDNIPGTNLKITNGIAQYYDQFIVGQDIFELKDTETLGEFKKKILDDLKKIGYKNDVVGIILDGGNDN